MLEYDTTYTYVYNTIHYNSLQHSPTQYTTHTVQQYAVICDDRHDIRIC